jgi:hypothetical protein
MNGIKSGTHSALKDSVYRRIEQTVLGRSGGVLGERQGSYGFEI